MVAPAIIGDEQPRCRQPGGPDRGHARGDEVLDSPTRRGCPLRPLPHLADKPARESEMSLTYPLPTAWRW
jgi:hypothetical protein